MFKDICYRRVTVMLLLDTAIVSYDNKANADIRLHPQTDRNLLPLYTMIITFTNIA